MKKLAKWAVLAMIAIGIFALFLLAKRVDGLPELEVWHTEELKQEFTAKDAVEGFEFEDYLLQEEQLFAALEEGFEGSIALTPTLEISRFEPGGFNNPLSFPRNWNRSFELVPEQTLSIDLRDLTVSPRAGTVPCVMPEGARSQLLEGTWDATAILLDAGTAIEGTAQALPYLDDFRA